MKVVIINFIYNECSIEPSMLFLWQFDVKKKNISDIQNF